MARRTRRQAMGQHFLVDEAMSDRIVEAAGLTGKDRVLEIGPGHGALTERLMNICPVTAIERDEVLAATLRARWGHKTNLELVEGDALKIDWPPFTALVANLPYSVATPILLRLLEGTQAGGQASGRTGKQASGPTDGQPGAQANRQAATGKPAWRVAVVMVQSEVARRLVSRDGRGYGRLSVAVAYRARAQQLFKVGREAFSPQPRVHSAVVRLEPLAEPPFAVDNEAFFFEVAARIFNHRRKTLRNCLRLAWPELEPEGLEGLDRRPEELVPAELAELADRIWPRLKDEGH